MVQNNPSHPDNIGHIVTHLGMNLDERLKEFKQFENDDQAFWDKVISGEEPEVPTAVLDGSARLTAEERVVVHGEIVESLWEEDFTTAEDQEIVEDLRERLKLFGLDASQAEDMVKKARVAPMRKRAPTEPFLVQPQREWEEAKKRLYEQAKRMAKLLLNHVELSMTGIELIYKYKSLNTTGKNNYVSAVMMMNHEINKRLGKERAQASTEEFKQILDNLDDVLQTLVRRVHKAKAEYEKKKPRGPVPSLIGSGNGRPKRLTVQRQCKCSRCHAPFAARDTCIAIPKLDGGYSTPKRVCDECFQAILEKTSDDLEAIKAL